MALATSGRLLPWLSKGSERGQRSDEVGLIGACGGEGHPDARGGFSDAGGDLYETKLQRGELRLSQNAALRLGATHRPE